MKIEVDNSLFEWIRSGRREMPQSRTPDWEGNFVSHLIPPIFESYSKILHRIEARYEHIDHPLTPAENAILRIPTCEPLRSFIEKRRANSLKCRIKWRELAHLLNVPFMSEICHEWYRKKMEDAWCWPRLLSGPGDGKLSEDECTELSSMLMQFTQSEECFFRFSDIPFYASPGPQLFAGTLSEVCGFPKGRAVAFEYCWPPEHDWCVCSDYDLAFTIVGGTSNLTSALLASDVLECIEVKPQTRIDSLAPMPLDPGTRL
jgi:hypothetical protein